MGGPRGLGRRAAHALLAVSLVAGASIVGSLVVPASASAQTRSSVAGDTTSRSTSLPTTPGASGARIFRSSEAPATLSATGRVTSSATGSNLTITPTGHKSFSLSLGGGGVTVHGIPMPVAKPAPSPTTTTVSLEGSRALVALGPNASVPYGELIVVVARVGEASGQTPVSSGTVDFSEDGAPVSPEYAPSAICQAVPVVRGTASCAITALAARSTPYRFGASYTPDVGSLRPSGVVSSRGPAVRVAQSSATLTLSGGPDPSSPGLVHLQAVVANGSPGSSLAPTGTVAFEVGGVALACAQGQPILTQASMTTSGVSCDAPAPSGSSVYTATYVPTNRGDVAVPSSASVTVSVSAPVGGVAVSAPATASPVGSIGASGVAQVPRSSTSCSSTFSTLWSDAASGPTTLTFSPVSTSLSFLGNLSLTEDATSVSCDPTESITFSGGSLSIAGGTLSGSGLGGTITDVTATTTSPQLCVTSGNLGGDGLTVSGSLCFSIGSATGSGGTIDNVSGASLSQVGQVSIASVLTLSGVSVNIGNGSVNVPTGCTLTNTNDWWLTVTGTLALSITTPSVSASATTTGCIDLSAGTKGTLELTTDLGTVNLGTAVTLSNFDVTLTYSSSGFGAQGSATVSIDMGTGSPLSVTVTVAFASTGTVVVAGSADLSGFLPSSLTGGGTVTAFVGFATAAYPSFDTGVTGVGTIDLVPGVNFAFSLSLPSSFTTALDSAVHIQMPSSILAVGSFDTSTDTFSLAFSISFSPPVQLFDSQSFNGQSVALDLNSASATLSVSPQSLSISLSMSATLYPDGTGQGAQSVDVTGTLTAQVSSTPAVSISVAVNEPTLGACGNGSGWSDAFGLSGLTVECAELTVGVTADFPFVTGSINGVITSLPSGISSAIGYQSGANIAFAFGFNPYYLDLSIGGLNSTTPALEPLQSIDNGKYASDLVVTYAQLCFMQPGATSFTPPGGPACSPGFVLGFTATIDVSVFNQPVTASVLASLQVGSQTSLDLSAQISRVSMGSDLSVGPVTLVMCVSTAQTCDSGTSYFQFEFTGSFSLSGSATVNNFVEVSGSLSMSLDVQLSTSGFTALLSGQGSGSIAFWNALTDCSGTVYEPWTWHCNGSWGNPATVGFNLAPTGITANSSGVTVTVDGTSVTFPFSSNSSPTVAPPTTSVALATSTGTSTYGQPVVLTATVSSSGGTAAFDGGGTTSFYFATGEPILGCSGPTAVALQDVNGTYTATCTTSTDVTPSSNDTMILPGGSDSIVARYSGDSNFPPATSSPVTETVNPATPTLTVSSSPSPDFYGQSLSLSVTVSPTDGGGTVTFLDNGSAVSTACTDVALTGDAGLGLGTDDSATATCSLSSTLAAGTHPITVSYSGDASATSALSTVDDVVVHKDNTTTSVSMSPTQATYGNESASVFTVGVTTAHGEPLPTTDPVTVHVGPATCTAFVSPTPGGGTGTCSIGNIDLGASTTAYTVTATYLGDADLNPSAPTAAAAGLTVVKDQTVTTVSASPPSSPYAKETAVVFTVNVAPHYGESLPGAKESVTVHVGSTSCTVALTPTAHGATGTCQFAPAVLPVGGPYAVSASYLGDSDLVGSTGTSSFSVVTTYTPDCSSYAGANLAGKNLSGANLAGCDLAGANLKGANLEGASLAGANLAGANLMGATLTGDNLVNADLAGANLKGDTIQYANLQGVDLQHANLMYANLDTSYSFTGANLEGANFQHATLTDADLEGSNLMDANFHYADLSGATLTNADVKGAQFKGANMTGVTGL